MIILTLISSIFPKSLHRGVAKTQRIPYNTTRLLWMPSSETQDLNRNINSFITLPKYKMDIRHQLWLILYFSIYLENKSTLNLGLNMNWPFGLSLHFACDLNMSLKSVMCSLKAYEFNFIWFKIDTLRKNIFSFSLE